jgi:hypothetical protein
MTPATLATFADRSTGARGKTQDIWGGDAVVGRLSGCLHHEHQDGNRYSKVTTRRRTLDSVGMRYSGPVY